MPPRKPRSRNVISGEIDGIVLQDVRADKVHVEQVRREATPQEQRQQEAKAARLALQNAISEKMAFWLEQANPLPADRINPYRFLTPLGPADSGRLAGRAAETAAILTGWHSTSTRFLSGADGIGKTSLILAGLVPSLLKDGHLPLYVEAGRPPLDVSIKRQLIPDLSVQPFLRDLPLAAFLREIGGLLLHGKRLYVLVDRLEAFCDQPELDRQAFKDEWALTISGAADVRWLFCVQASRIHTLNFFAPEIQPFSLLTVLSPLERQAGWEILLGAAEQAKIQVEPALLDALLDDWQKDVPDPLRLQLAAYYLAGAGGGLVDRLTLAEYERQGRLPGILRGYLERSIGELLPPDREPAWRILSALLESDGKAARSHLEERLRSDGLSEADFARVADLLRVKHILCLEDDCYRLSSASLNIRIEQWQAEQAAKEQVRQEFKRQVRHIRNSALRGMLAGGLLGFPPFAALAYPGNLFALDLLFVVFFFILAVTVGGMAGLLVTMGADVILAVYTERTRRFGCYLAATLWGGLAMWFSMLAYLGLFANPDSFAGLLSHSFILGVPWGALLGLGIVQAKDSRVSLRAAAQIAVLASLICALLLIGLESVLNLLGVLSPFLFGLGGFWFSLSMVVASLFGQRSPARG